jgi:phenylacetate-CoA ligase
MPEPILRMRSQLDGVAWPAMPSPHGALLAALLFQLERTQWWSAEQLVECQLLQLRELLQHAYHTVPFYRERFDACGLRPGPQLDLDDLHQLPLLTRRDIQSAGPALSSRAVPPDHGPVTRTQTSGSTGEPVRVYGTAVNQLLWEALTLRDHLWHRRDLAAKLASIRVIYDSAGEPPHGTVLDNWSGPAAELWVTGPAAALQLSADIDTQARWLKQHEPDYLLTYPTNLMALIAHFSARAERPQRLREVRAMGETLTPEMRAQCLEQWGVPIIDMYSSQELGCIALQCPDGAGYHLMAESVYAEILDDDGRACRPGAIGRLVLTSLHNFAMPLIRYELRDYAEAGAPCRCGRGLPTVARIVGRTRNMLTLPTGELRWPLVGYDQYREIAPIRQYQLIQHSLQQIEVRLVAERPVSADEELRLSAVIRQALGYPFPLRFVYFADHIPRGPGGKFEEFVSRIAS